jgi:AcrR family transcriptional regulator
VSDQGSSPEGAPPKRKRGRPRHDGPTAEYTARRQEIVDTAARVFRRKGYMEGSLEDVAAELDLRKSALYHYVESKAELLYLIFERTTAQALEHFEKLLDIQDPAERLKAMIHFQVLIIADNPDYYAVFFDHRPRLREDYEETIRERERRYVRMFARFLQDAVDAGAVPSVDIRSGAQGLLGMTSWIYKWFDPQRDDPETIADTFVRMLFPVGARSSRPETTHGTGA